MNLQMCNSMCQSEDSNASVTFTRFGIQSGTQCWCGNNPGSYGAIEADCTDTCVGSPNVECGGQSSISVYEVQALLVSRQGTQAQCTACPTIDGAFEVKYGTVCRGGWYPPIAKKKFWSSPAFPDQFYQCFHGRCDGGYVKGDIDINTMQGNYSMIQQCGAGAKGRMCAGCKKGHWKFGKDCRACYNEPQSYFVHVFAPMLCLCYFPMLKYLIGGGRIPSLFVSNAFLQITALFGGYAVNWPSSISKFLSQVSVVNFNWNLMFFGCADDRPKLIDNWVMFQLLPIFYATFFFSRHYIYKWASIQKGSLLCTFLGSTPKSFFGSTDFYPSLQASLFMANLLYLATLSKSLMIFACDRLPDGTYYMTQAPGVVCYEGDHVKLMVLAICTMCFYSVGFPVFLFFSFMVAKRKYLFDDPKFKGMLGFLYTRFDTDW